jgi:cobalt-zinc-cadmium efflux system protein
MSHHHDHHDHPETSWGRRLIATMIMNLIIPAVQVYGGILSGSMALISDALHNLMDFVSVLISYAALRLGQRGPTLEQTFGYKRLEVLGALLNVALLFGASFYILVESWSRLQDPQPIKGGIVIWAALIGFTANLISTLMLRAGSKVNLNMRGAFLHMLTDALTSLGVALLGVVWLYRPWYWLDPVVTSLIIVMILYSGWDILKEAFGILMNATPPGIDLRGIKREVEALEGVEDMHHLHAWSISSGQVALAAHLIVQDQMLCKVDELAGRVRVLLSERFRIQHPILQFETRVYETTGLLCCAVAERPCQAPRNGDKESL